MSKPKLYLFIGHPGAGKTSVAQIIAKETGATHLWADAERHRLFKNPTHSTEESAELYDKLNKATDYLLGQGRSVVFDTNFNFYGDRQKLRDIAERNNAETKIIWLTTPVDIAKERAVHAEIIRNGYSQSMDEAQFDAIVSKLEPPAKNEKVIKIDGTTIDSANVKELLSL